MRWALAEGLRPIQTTAIDPASDEALAQRVVAGERLAYDTLVRRHQRRVLGLMLRFVRHPEDAKDLAQRAFVRAYEGLAGFRGEASFRTWLYRIAANLAMNHMRDRKPTVDVSDLPLAVEALGERRLLDAETRARLRTALDGLPPKQRLVVELRIYEELSFREAGEIAGCTENAAKVNFHHAVQKLRACLLETER